MKKQRIKWMIGMAVLLFLQMLVLVYYGSQKAGFHEDELYSYYSSNKTAGLFVNDREWTKGEAFEQELTVLRGEQFRYGVVKQMQSWDVHPPLYYDLLHTVCSLTPGVFSKWQGISINMAGFVLSFVLLALVTYRTVTDPIMADLHALPEQKESCQRRGYLLALLVCAAWGFGGAVISGVMFIRMYQWLTVFVLLCMWIHLLLLRSRKQLLCHILLGMTVFLGFMTQYYYIIFHFFLGAAFCVYLLKEKKWKQLMAYVGTCAVSLGLALLYYPAALSHIFKGYRGTEAVGEFVDASNTLDRLQFFIGLFDDYMLGGMLAVLLLVLCLLLITRWSVRKRGCHMERVLTAPVILMLCAAGGYFFTVSKTSLLLGETSNRYELPVYGLLLLLILYGLYGMADGLFGQLVKEHTKKQKQEKGIAVWLTAFLTVLLVVLNLAGNKVFFLYPEEAQIREFVKANEETPVVVLYHEGSETHIWWLLDELSMFDNIYLASLGNEEPLSASDSFGEVIEEAEASTGEQRLIVYVADYDNQEERMAKLLPMEEWSLTQIAQKNMWTIYEAAK